MGGMLQQASEWPWLAGIFVPDILADALELWCLIASLVVGASLLWSGTAM
jgi:hypothetical protein